MNDKIIENIMNDIISSRPIQTNTQTRGDYLPTRGDYLPTKNSTGQQAVQPNQNSCQVLSEQGKAAKSDLEVLVATGKTKELTGKALTFNDLDCMSEKDLLKYHRVYQNSVAARINDTFSILLKTS